MGSIYEYWRPRVSGEVWAVALDEGRVVAAVQIDPRDVQTDLLPFLPYRSAEASAIERERQEFRRVDGRKVA